MTDQNDPLPESPTTPITIVAPPSEQKPAELECSRCGAKWYSKAPYDMANPKAERLCPICTTMARRLEHDALHEAQEHARKAAEAILIAARMREAMGDETAERDAGTYRAVAMLCSGMLDEKLLVVLANVKDGMMDGMFEFASHFHPEALERLIVNEPPPGAEEPGAEGLGTEEPAPVSKEEP